MRSACVTAIASLLLGCTPNASTQPPEGAQPVGDPQAAAEPATPDAAEPAATAELATASVDEGERADGGGEADAAEPTATADAGTDAAEPTAAADAGTDASEPATKPAATLSLPKPLHAKLDAKCGKDPGVGKRLESFALPGLEEGKQVTQSTFRGRVLVVNFWGTWCKPCLEELPKFDQLYRRYRKHGMTLLAIATDEDAEAVKALVDKRKLGAKIAIAGEGYAGQYDSPKFPFTFVVDHKGVIQASYRGYEPECMGQLEADIREQLQVRAEAKAKAQRRTQSQKG